MSALAFRPMPLNSVEWLTKHELIKRAQVTARWIELLCKKSFIISRELDQRSPNGRPVREFLVSSLPAELRSRLQPAAPAALQIVPQPQALAPLFAHAAPTPTPLQISLAPRQERLARQVYDIILPLVKFEENRAAYAQLRLGDGRAVTTAVLMAEYIVETRRQQGHKCSVRSLWRWVGEYKAGGLPALARKPREDQGTSHFFTRYPAAARLVAAGFLRPHASYQSAYDLLVRDRELLRIPPAELPSYGTVVRYLDSLPESAKILAREGQRRYNDTCAPHLARAYTDIPVNSIWVADHQIHDCWVRNDCFAGAPIDAAMRLRLTAIMDMRSRKLVGYCWAVEGDSRGILTALRRAVERFGPCEIFYCDNGVDFKKVARGARRMRPSDQQIRMAAEQVEQCGAIQQLGARVQFCLPYHAQSKPIERLFRFVHERLDGIMHTYLTGNAYNRPDAATLAGEHHRHVVKKGRAHESTMMPAIIFIKLAETWIEQDYNQQHKHSGKGMNGRTPDAVFEEGYPAEKRRAASAEVLALLLYERRRCLVRRTAVTIDKRRYMPLPSSPAGWAELNARNGLQLTVAFDPLDPRRAVALNEKNQIIAELQPEELAAHPLEPTPETRKHTADMSQIRGRLLKANSISIATMHQEVAMAGHKSAIEHLADRALVTVPVDDLVSQRAVRRATRPSDTAHAPASSFDIAADLMKELA